MTPRILLIEDEESLVLTLSDALSEEGYYVESSQNGQQGFEMASQHAFDVIILDIMLPEKNGFDLCRDLRGRGIRTPILMLTARGQLVDKILGFKLGADDYLTKPFEVPELLARLEALLRRTLGIAGSGISETYDFGSVRVDLRSTEVLKEGQPVELSAREFQLLRYFIAHPGRVISRDELLEEVWRYESSIFTRTVDVHVSQLRKKLDSDPKKPKHFITVRGMGYRFIPA